MTSRLQARLLAQRALFQRLQSSKKRNKLQAGFTLIELLIVVIIIGVLASIALPAFLSQGDRARENAVLSGASSGARACLAGRIVDNSTNTGIVAPLGGTCADGADVTYTQDGYVGSTRIGSGGSIVGTWVSTDAEAPCRTNCTAP